MRARTPLIAAVIAGLLMLGGGPASAQTPREIHVSTQGTLPSRQPSSGQCVGGTADSPYGGEYVRPTDGAVIGAIEYALRCAAPGDTVILHGGTYTERVSPVTVPGRPDAPITVRSAQGEHAVIRGLLRLAAADYWRLSDIEITNDGGTYGGGEYLLKMRGGVGWQLSRIHAHGSISGSYAVLRIEPHGTSPVRDFLVTQSCFRDAGPNHADAGDHNAYVVTGRGGSGIIERSVMYGAPGGQNIKLGGGTGPSENVVIRHNTFHSAVQNILLFGASSGIVIEGNLLSTVYGKSWYPNVRGYSLTGEGNVVRENAAWTGNDAAGPVFTGSDGDTSTAGIQERSNSFGEPLGVELPHCVGAWNAGTVTGVDALVPSETAPDHDRVAGASRVETSVAVSRRYLKLAETVVLARADDYADALAGSPLAAHLDAPILLTQRDELPDAVATEIRRLDASTAVVLGGPHAIGQGVERTLRAMGLQVERVEGGSRFATAVQIANRLPDSDEAYLVEGTHPDPRRGWPDAAGVAHLAAHERLPILLTHAQHLPSETAQAIDALGIQQAVIVGGTTAVAPDVEQRLTRRNVHVKRVAGNTRWETSVAIVRRALSRGMPTKTLMLATGETYPDALSGGAVLGHDGGLMLLVPGSQDTLPTATADLLADLRGDVASIVGIGGPASLSESLLAEASRRTDGG